MIATADSDRTTVSPARSCGPACSRITFGMSFPGIRTGVRIGTRSKERPSTTTVRGVGGTSETASDIETMVPARPATSPVAHRNDPGYAPASMTPTSRTATPARLAVIAAVLAILATVVVRPALGSAGARAMGPLPACRYDDILTTPRGYADWSITLVDTILRVPRAYVPPDLVSTAEAGVAGGGKVRAVMIDDLRAMAEAAATAGNEIGVRSAYRSYASQESVFASWVAQLGYKRALQVSARPGHSEHQLGLAIDFRSEPADATLTTTWASTPAGKWMKVHAWEYGFVMSYPKDSIALTCYDFEPWHYRYVGRDLASLIRASGLTQ